MVHAANLDRAGETAEPAGDGHDDDGQRLHPEPCIGCGARIGAEHRRLEAEHGLPLHDGEHDHHDERDDQSGMKPRARHDHRQDAIWRDGVGPRPERHRVGYRSADEIAHHLHRHVIQHDRDDDLTGIETLAQIADEGAKRGAADESEDQKGNESGDAPTGEIGCKENGHDRPSDQLAVTADIEQAGA